MHLREFSDAVISLPGAMGSGVRSSFECIVIAVGGHTVALEPDDAPSLARLPEEVRNAYLTYEVGDTTFGLRGRLLSVGNAADLRFISTDDIPRGGRRFTRIELVAPVSIRFPGSDQRVAAWTVNLSATGALVDSDVSPLVGDRVELRLSLVDAGELTEGARVTRVDGGRFALEFDRPAGAIGRLVVDRNRGIIRGRRGEVPVMGDAEF